MKKILTIYPNCSLGGMTSVYLGRALTSGALNQFDFIFMNDKGGRNAFSNFNYRILRKDRLKNYFSYILKELSYDEIRVTSFPELTHFFLDKPNCTKVIYEFHTSSLDIIQKEISNLNTDVIDEIWVPSLYLKGIVQNFIDPSLRIIVVPNIVNFNIFNPMRTSQNFIFPKSTQPIFWVGRLDKGKNYKEFFRLLSLLPKRYEGYVVLSFENEPTRISEALLEAEMYNIGDRVHFLLNLSQEQLADLYVNSFNHNGIFCSTSLAESFGYGVLEAAICGLPVVTYEVGGISEHSQYNFAIQMVNVGDTVNLAKAIKSLNWNSCYEKNIIARDNYIDQAFSY